jgi:hypothetical protein
MMRQTHIRFLPRPWWGAICYAISLKSMLQQSVNKADSVRFFADDIKVNQDEPFKRQENVEAVNLKINAMIRRKYVS